MLIGDVSDNMSEYLTNISNLSPTHFVFSIDLVSRNNSTCTIQLESFLTTWQFSWKWRVTWGSLWAIELFDSNIRSSMPNRKIKTPFNLRILEVRISGPSRTGNTWWIISLYRWSLLIYVQIMTFYLMIKRSGRDYPLRLSIKREYAKVFIFAALWVFILPNDTNCLQLWIPYS